MKPALVVLFAAACLAGGFGASSAKASSGQPMCAIDPDTGDCMISDGYDVQDAGTYYSYYAGNGESCKAVWAYRGRFSFFGDTFYKYYEQVNWCYRGGVITSFSRWRWPEQHWPWQFDGDTLSNCLDTDHCTDRAFSGIYQTTVLTQGDFHACVIPVVGGVVCNYKHPWVRLTVNAYGGWGYETRG